MLVTPARSCQRYQPFGRVLNIGGAARQLIIFKYVTGDAGTADRFIDFGLRFRK
jgi:hypothetical protein